MIEEKVNELKHQLTDYAALVVQMVESSIQGLIKKDDTLLNQVIENDETRANEFEIEVDELCATFIVKYQPRAKDLRTILTALKMNNDLERIADHAVNIAQSALFLTGQPLVTPLLDISNMAKEVTAMLNDGVNAFIHEDATLAKSVCERDSRVDGMRNYILRELMTHMTTHPDTVERALHVMNITKNLERIADLSTNLCEEVIFLVDGRVIMHHHEEKGQAAL